MNEPSVRFNRWFWNNENGFFHPNVSQLSISASPALLTKEEQACKHCPIYFQAFPSPVIGKIRTSFQWETWANFWKKNSLRNAFDFSRLCQWAVNYNRFKQLFANNFHREKMRKIILKCTFQQNSYWLCSKSLDWHHHNDIRTFHRTTLKLVSL